jgi:type II secretory pathway pseudopilin PulG
MKFKAKRQTPNAKRHPEANGHWLSAFGSSGFTLVELLLYLGITSIMILVISAFVQVMFESRAKHQTVTEVEQQGQIIMNMITQSVRKGRAICTPTINATSNTTLSVDTGTGCGANAPTIYDINAGVLRLKEASATQVALTNSRVAASGFSARDLTVAGGKRSVRITFTLSYAGGSTKNEYTYSKVFQASGSLR